MRADLVRASGEQLALDERQPAFGGQRAVAGARGFRAGHARAVQRDLLAFFVAAQEVLNQPFGRMRPAVDNAQIAFLQLAVLDLVI